MALFAALPPVSVGGSSATPPASGTGTDSGAYNAFPLAAAHADGRVLCLWTHSRGHSGTGASFAQGSIRSGAGVWGAPFTAWDDASATVGVSPGGLTFMPARGSFPARWALVGQSMTFSSSTSSSVTARAVKVRTSTDGTSWADLGVNPWAGAWYDDPDTPVAPSWVIPTDLLWVDDGTDGGNLFAAGYASWPGHPWEAVVAVSRDRGASWTYLGFPYLSRPSALGSTSISEPRLVADPDTPGAVLVFVRDDDHKVMWRGGLVDNTRLASSSGYWIITGRPQTLVQVLQGVSGLPVVHRDSTGGWHAFVRDTAKQRGDLFHCPWNWFTSTDGVQWVSQGDFTGTGRSAMYAAATNLPDGSFLLVHASEDGAAYGPSSVYASIFTQIQCSAVVKYDAVPRVEVRSSLPAPVMRVWTDADGNEQREQVRINAGNSTMWIDYEAPRGVALTYVTKAGTTDPVRVRETEGLWLIHPVRPALSMQVTVREQGDVTNDLDLNEVSVMGRANPVTVSGAVRGGDKFTLTVRTETDQDARALTRLLKDGAPLFLGGRRSYMLPAWVRIGSTSQNRLWQWDGEQRRVWELPCTEIDRPSAVDLPSLYRIRDLNLSIRALTGKIRDGLMPN